MSTDIKLWFFLQDEFFYPWIVPSRVAPDVCHQYFYPLTTEYLIFWKLTSQFMTIDIAINAPEWFFFEIPSATAVVPISPACHTSSEPSMYLIIF